MILPQKPLQYPKIIVSLPPKRINNNDHEPIHVHVVKGGAEARFQVQP
jgi:hypothetical protein